MKIVIGGNGDDAALVCSKCGGTIDDEDDAWISSDGNIVLCEACREDIMERLREDIYDSKWDDVSRITCERCGGTAEFEYDGETYCESCLSEIFSDEADEEAEEQFDEEVRYYL